jgi:hypothetical protein
MSSDVDHNDLVRIGESDKHPPTSGDLLQMDGAEAVNDRAGQSIVSRFAALLRERRLDRLDPALDVRSEPVEGFLGGVGAPDGVAQGRRYRT